MVHIKVRYFCYAQQEDINIILKKIFFWKKKIAHFWGFSKLCVHTSYIRTHYVGNDRYVIHYIYTQSKLLEHNLTWRTRRSKFPFFHYFLKIMCNNPILLLFFQKIFNIDFFDTHCTQTITCYVGNDRYIIAVTLAPSTKRYHMLPKFGI